MTMYRDSEGRECELPTMCRREPEWAASRIAKLSMDLEAARAALGEAWLHDGATLAEGIRRKTRALESMPGARAVALVDAIVAAHRDDVLPRIRALAEAVVSAASDERQERFENRFDGGRMCGRCDGRGNVDGECCEACDGEGSVPVCSLCFESDRDCECVAPEGAAP